MRFIDEDGKLFGKINLFDLLIVSLMLLIVLSLYPGVMKTRFVRKDIVDIPVKEYVDVDVMLSDAQYFLKEYIKIGDIRKKLGYEAISQVINIKEINKCQDSANLLVTFRVLARKERGDILMFGKFPLIVGGSFILQTPEYIVQGYIKDVYTAHNQK